MSRPSLSAAPARSPREVRAPAHAAELSAELAAAWAGAPDRWRPLVRHVPAARWFEPLPIDRDGPDVTAWLITWAPGTGLDLHDHGGSAGTLAVVGGELFERHTTTAHVGALGDGLARARLRPRHLRTGSVVSFGDDHVHEVRNDGLQPAVSIHVYVPGLSEMAFYGAPAGDRPGVHTRTTDPREERS
jgi:hypothetical protein